jgi:hypothetical protein
MDQKPDQIEKHIRKERAELKDNFEELGSKVKNTFDWRTQFQERPGTMLGFAVAGGVLLSAIFRGGSRRSERLQSLDKENFTPVADAGNSRARGLETWDHMKGALVGAAINNLASYIEQVLPGFQTEYEKSQRTSTGRKTSETIQ